MSTTSPTGPAQPTSARRRETRARLVDAAAQVIAEAGVMGASVEQICETAGFTRGAFYSNFDTKDELWAAVLRDFFESHLLAARQMTAVIPALPEDADRETVAGFVDAAIEHFIEMQPDDPHWPIVNTELHLHALRTPEFRPVYIAIQREIEQQLIDLLAPAFESRGLRLSMPLAQAISLITAVHNAAELGSGLQEQPHPSVTAANLKALLHSLLLP